MIYMSEFYCKIIYIFVLPQLFIQCNMHDKYRFCALRVYVSVHFEISPQL